MADTYNCNPTPKQIKTVNAVLTGETNLGKAMQDAGYSPKTSENPKQNFMESRGVQAYLQQLDEKARQRFRMSVIDKAFEIYLEAMGAKRFVSLRSTDNGYKHRSAIFQLPDHQTRMQAAEKILRLYGIDKEQLLLQQQNNQFNVHVTEEEKAEFNKKFQKFLMSEYSS